MMDCKRISNLVKKTLVKDWELNQEIDIHREYRENIWEICIFSAIEIHFYILHPIEIEIDFFPQILLLKEVEFKHGMVIHEFKVNFFFFDDFFLALESTNEVFRFKIFLFVLTYFFTVQQ